MSGCFELTSAPECPAAGQSHLCPELVFGPPTHPSAPGVLKAGRRLGTELELGQRSRESQAEAGEGHPRCRGGEGRKDCVVGVRGGFSPKPSPPATDLWCFPFKKVE